MSTASIQPTIWTEELAIETQLWMRYMTFRPWYQDHSVMDLGATSRFGVRYASNFATSAELHAPSEPSDLAYEEDRFGYVPVDIENCVVTGKDVLICLESLNEVANPEGLIQRLAGATGTVILGYRPDSNWTEEAFRTSIDSAFQGRTIQYWWQRPEWPYRLTTERCEGSIFLVATISDFAPIEWPRLGFSVPTVDSPGEVREAILGMTRTYPGEIHFAVVANGSSDTTLESLNQTRQCLSDHMTLLESPTNLGYGQGSNRGLEYLRESGKFDYFGVTNDDVIPETDCISELVWGMRGLETLGLRPGVIGPVSNSINGRQQVDIGALTSYAELLQRCHRYRVHTAGSMNQVRQLRGLCLLIHPDLLESIGGFDPRFGLGNFEDDDHNLRTHLAGFTLWIAEGAFLYHHGSTTFRQLGIDYTANIARNAETMAAKWQLTSPDQWVNLHSTPRGVALHVPLDAWSGGATSHNITINGEQVDLVQQASDLEFAAWVMNSLKQKPRSERAKVIEILNEAA